MHKVFSGKFTRLTAVIAAVLLALMCFTVVACGTPDDDNVNYNPVKSIKVTQKPTKIEYREGEEFDPTGGEITATFKDGTTKVVSMTDDDVTFLGNSIVVSDPNLTIQNKNVTVVYGEKEATFRIRVSLVMYNVTFDYNYDGVTNPTFKVKNGNRVTVPEDPERDNFTFIGWFSDRQCTMEYDFGSAITANTSIYAKWLGLGTYYKVSFDYNYKGAPKATVQQVEEGGISTRLSVDPKRYGYAFGGWYTSAECNSEFSFDTVINADTRIYAKWTKTISAGTREYLFEAENTDLTGKTGKGLSGTTSATGMIQTVTDLGASGNKFIGYQYSNGCFITFNFISDAEVHDAKIVVRLSAEHRNFSLNKDLYRMELNGVPVDYGTITFTNVPPSSSDVTEVRALPFKDYVIIQNATLVEGLNTVELCTINSDGMSGTTIEAKAPLIDCIKVTTSAVLEWSAAHGLPKNI